MARAKDWDDYPPMLSAAQAAEIMQCDVRMIRDMARREGFPALFVGREARISKDGLRALANGELAGLDREIAEVKERMSSLVDEFAEVKALLQEVVGLRFAQSLAATRGSRRGLAPDQRLVTEPSLARPAV